MSTEAPETEHSNAEPVNEAAEAMVADIAAKIASGELELPEELPAEGMQPVPPELEGLEPEPEVLWFKCKYGHVQQGDYFFQVKNPHTGEITWRTGPMCTRCQAEWLGKKFETRQIPAPTSSKQ